MIKSKYNFAAFFLALSFISCKSTHLFSDNDLIKLISENDKRDKAHISFDGFYNNTELVKSLFNNDFSPLILDARINNFLFIGTFFFNNGMLYSRGTMLSRDNEIEMFGSSELSYFYSMLNGWGFYNVENDLITAMVYRRFQNRFKLPRWETKLVKYEGKILNDSTIINWRQVPPYPNKEADQIDTIPRTLNFVEFPEKKFIDPKKSVFYKEFKNYIEK